MLNVSSLNLPPLPLLLWETPPGLELILGQEGIAFVKVVDPHPLAFRGGRVAVADAASVPAGGAARGRGAPPGTGGRRLLQARRPAPPRLPRRPLRGLRRSASLGGHRP